MKTCGSLRIKIFKIRIERAIEVALKNEVRAIVGVLWVGENLGIAPEKTLCDFLLIHRNIERSAYPYIVERFGVGAHGDVTATMLQPARPLELRCVLFEL